MSTAPLEEKIKKGFTRHGKDITGSTENVGKEFVKAGKEISKSVLKIGEAGLDASMAVGKGVYGVSKATVGAGVAVTKTALAMATFPYRRRRSFRDYFWKAKGGVITGAADNDPAGIATYSQVGASTGFSLLWLAIITTPMLIAVEEMSARVGVVVKKGLNTVIREKFGVSWAIFAAIILTICNIATLGADLAGMSAVLGMVTGVSWHWFLIPLSILILLVLIKGRYSSISRFLFLVTPFLLLYVITAFIVKPDILDVVKGTFIPTFGTNTAGYLAAAIGVLGTTISAYLLFWETSQEIEQNRSIDHLEKESRGVTLGMIFCNMIFYFIIVCTGAVFFSNGINNIESASQAAEALKPLAGNFAYLLFSIGIFTSGLVAVPVLASSTSYVISDAFGWNAGLNLKVNKAKAFYVTMTMAFVAGVSMSLFGLNPMKMLFYSQVLQGILTPILLVFLVMICNDKKIMGEFTNKFGANFWGWFAIILMGGLSIIMFWQLLVK